MMDMSVVIIINQFKLQLQETDSKDPESRYRDFLGRIEEYLFDNGRE